MEHRTGEQARNEEFRENDSPEQEKKIDRNRDIEPQAEQWGKKTEEDEKETSK